MISTFHGIEIGKRGLMVHQKALGVVGHNLGNMNQVGYSRQQVELKSGEVIMMPGVSRLKGGGQIGGGVAIDRIQRIRDEFLDHRIIEEKGNFGYFSRLDFFLSQVEGIHQEPGGQSLKVWLDQFIEGWNDLSLDPGYRSHRESIREVGIGLSQNIQRISRRFLELREQVEGSIVDKVKEFNEIIVKIARLNSEIVRVEGEGDFPNDLKDERDRLVESISVMADLNVGVRDKDEHMIYLGGEILIQGDKYEQIDLEEDGENEGLVKLVWGLRGRGEGEVLKLKKEVLDIGGELGGLLRFRDVELKREMDRLDQYAMNLMDTVNEIHRGGYHLNGGSGVDFFEVKRGGDGKGGLDWNKDGLIDSTGVYKVEGTEVLSREDIVGSRGRIELGGEEGEEVIVEYNETDTVGGVIEKLNSANGGVVAYLNEKGELTIKAVNIGKAGVKDLIIEHLEDSGIFLTQYSGLLREGGELGGYDWKRVGEEVKFLGEVSYMMEERVSDWMGVSEEVRLSANNIAAGLEGARGDGRNALRVVSALMSEGSRNELDREGVDMEKVLIDGSGNSFRSFLEEGVEKLGVVGREAKLSLEQGKTILNHLENSRQSISGVNIDEEMAQMVKYQHGYNASARLVSYIDEILDILINRMAV